MAIVSAASNDLKFGEQNCSSFVKQIVKTCGHHFYMKVFAVVQTDNTVYRMS